MPGIKTREEWAAIKAKYDKPGGNQRSIPHPPPDLDAMSAFELGQFIARYGVRWGRRKMFPTRPRNYTYVADTLLSMARLRIMYLATGIEGYLWAFDRSYLTLEKYAQWPRKFDVLRCVAEGQKFRKWPKKKDRNGKWH